MQSEPNETSQKDSLDSHNQGLYTSTHHGHQQQDHQSLRQRYFGGYEDTSRPPSTRASSATSSEGFNSIHDRAPGGLIATRRQDGSPVNRILEHERLSTRSSKKKHGGPGFTVVAASRDLRSHQVGIADFPNGLTLRIFARFR